MKKEIDKELMYKKLMPSHPKAAKMQVQEITEQIVKNEAEETLENHNENHSIEAFISHQQPSHREIGIPALDAQKMILANTMESIVTEKLESVLARFQCCKCDRCKKDIVAIALNKLPPKYMVLAEGQPTPIITTQENAQVVSAIIQAVLTVRNHARH